MTTVAMRKAGSVRIRLLIGLLTLIIPLTPSSSRAQAHSPDVAIRPSCKLSP